jgi:hypothetical protein
MFRTKIAGVLLASLAVLGMTAQAASADPPPKVEIAGLYSAYHNDAGTFPIGWVFAVGGNVTNWMAIVGEVGGAYRSATVFGTDLTIKEYTALGGVKFASRRSHAAVPFVQVLTGIDNVRAGFEGMKASVYGYAFQTGGGLDIRMGSRSAIRVQGDYRLRGKDGRYGNEFRFAAGVVFGFGKR